ncbi:MAG: hypothetical protein QXN33_04630 [Candidatus Bathyarchaeia archaeon]
MGSRLADPWDRAEEISRAIWELKERAKELKARRDSYNSDAKLILERREGLSLKLREIIREIRSNKSARDELNKSLKELRAQELELKRKVSAAMKAMGRSSKLDEAGLEEEIRRLDWVIQTSSLPIEREKELVERVRRLESELAEVRRQISFRKDLEEMRRRIEGLRSEIAEKEKERDEFHARVVSLAKAADSLRGEIREAESRYVEVKGAADATHREYLGCLERIKELRAEIKAMEEERVRRRMEELERAASEKFKNRRKLSFEEFKILMEKKTI